MFNQTALVNEMDSLRRFAIRLTGNTVDADDLMQSTLLRALEKKEYFQTGTDLFKWTSKIMFNLFVSNYRRKKKFETQYDPESYLEKASVASEQEANTEILLVQEAMKKLSAERAELRRTRRRLISIEEMREWQGGRNAGSEPQESAIRDDRRRHSDHRDPPRRQPGAHRHRGAPGRPHPPR